MRRRIDDLDLACQTGIVDAGAATDHLGGGQAEGGCDHRRGRGGVADAHVAADQQLGAGGDLLASDGRTSGQGALRLLGAERVLQVQRALGGQGFKRRMVDEGIAHAALVLDGDRAIGWCEYGSPAELPHIYHRKEYDETTANPAPYRITCFFVDRDHRRQGVATAALHGALDLIARGGGGLVEAFPMNGLEKKTSSSFLYSGLRSTFEAAGFEYQRPIGTKRCVMTRLVTAA